MPQLRFQPAPDFNEIIELVINMKRQTTDNKDNFPFWQITLPLCAVLIFCIGTFTTIHMVNGRYLFDLELTPQGLKVKTDVDKRETQSIANNHQEEAKDNSE